MSEPTIQDELARRAAEKNWNVSEVTSMIAREMNRPRDAVVKELILLSKEKKLTLTEKSPYRSFLDYAVSPYSLWSWAALAATVLSVALTLVSSGFLIYLRYLFGSALVLFLPGFSLVELLYTKRGELDEFERLALSIGLSLALSALIGLVLNYTPLGLRPTPVLGSLAGLAVILLFLAVRAKLVYYKLVKGVV
jgi:hypothetical protein